MDQPDEPDITTVESEDEERIRIFSEKGQVYDYEKLSVLFDKLQRQSDYLRKLIGEKSSFEVIKSSYTSWMSDYELYLENHNTHLQRLPRECKEQYLLTFEEREKYITSFKRSVEDYFTTFKPPSEHQSESAKGAKCKGAKTSSSNKSSSVLSNISSKRLKEEQKKVEIETKLSALKRKRELEMAKLRLKQEEEELELSTDLAVVDAKSKVLDKFEHLSMSQTEYQYYMPPTLNPEAEPFHSYQSKPIKHIGEPFHPYVYQNKHIAEQVTPTCNVENKETAKSNLDSVVQHLKKPQSEIKKFSGNTLEFKKFIRQFNLKVCSNTDDYDERMSYLDQFTTGEANKVVSGFSHLDGKHAYKTAMAELEERYGNQDVIAAAYSKRALNWPSIKIGDGKSLDDFALFLVECQSAMENNGSGSILEFSENIRTLVSKLPFNLHDRWRNVVLRTKENRQSVKFSQFVKFIKDEVKKINDPAYGNEALGTQKSKTQLGGRLGNRTDKLSHSSVIQNVNSLRNSSLPTDTPKCCYCKSDTHGLSDCKDVMTMQLQKRCELVRKNGLCFGCLRKGHLSKDCRRRSTCKSCGRKHPTILHDESKAASTAINKHVPIVTGTSAIASVNSTDDLACELGAGDVSCAMAIIPVKVKLKNKPLCIDTYAFFDSGSSVSFCTEEIMYRLGGSGKRVQVTLNTMGTPCKMNTFSLKGLQVCDIDLENIVDMPNVFTKEEMPVSLRHIPKNCELSKWPHLSGIKMPTLNDSSSIGIMIGNNVPDAYTPLEVATGPAGSPHATKTRLGWITWNLIRNGDVNVMQSVNRAEIQAIQDRNQQLETLVRESINLDFPERIIDDKREYSQEDKYFVKQVSSSIQQTDGHFVIDLPFREPNVKLPNNLRQAEQRLKGLKSKFKKNQTFQKDYIDFMNKITSQGYAELVPEDQLQQSDGRVWYLPHHGIYHPKKPSKLRVVFDCSAVYSGVSLNTLLLQGPDLSNNLLGVLLRFRENQVAILGDIESMFHQVKVPEKDRDCLRFLWWPTGNMDKAPSVFRMTVHLFGATSSPSCCNYALRHTAEIYGNLFEPCVQRTILRDMYVDDCLTSVPTEAEAVNLVKCLSQLCEKGGFHLTKWVSNRSNVVLTIPETERGNIVKHLDIKSDQPIERALGVCWFVESDQLGFSIQLKDQPATRRGILSIVSSVYDPLGVASPFVLIAKALLQKLCRKEIGWDDPIDEEEKSVWNKWMSKAKELENVTIDRCYKPDDFGKVVSSELHCFGDASNTGYGMVFYLRLVNEQGRIHCSFLLGKSRVAPLKAITVPRLELTASARAVQLCKMITDELRLVFDKIYFWTDSMSVLRYIANRNARFHTFVANRLAVIQESTTNSQWKFVNSKENPADVASRGMDASLFLRDSQWLHGPQFLWKSENEWPDYPVDRTLHSDDVEVKEIVTTCTCMASTTTPVSGMDRLISYFSSWEKLKRITAWMLKYMQILKERIGAKDSAESKSNQKVKPKTIHLTTELVQRAEHVLIRYTQRQCFPVEYGLMRNAGDCADSLRLTKKSKLYKLDAFMKDDLLRVGGRLDSASMSFEAKHPIILPKESQISRLIIESIHRRIGHLGKNSILAVLRQNYSVIGASSIIKGLVSKCVICRKYQGRPSEQKMANLPEERLAVDEPPFSRIGIDYFGPFLVKRGRSQLKRYGVIFTCLSSRAVHLEVAHSLNTDSCIDALRRFIARRGVPNFIRTDNGTNFIASERELREEIANFNLGQINDFMIKQNIRWEFNPPAASHFGGVWERLIRSVRKVLYSILQEQIIRFDDEGLHTLFCEVESVLNGRPLTQQPDVVNDLAFLTPNHLLLMRPGESFPPGVFNKSDNYVQRRWKQIQYLADIFWKRWTKEYLSLLQVRQKWNHTCENVKVDDIVLIVENAPRNVWNLGKIVEVMKDKSGSVRVVKLKTATGVLTRPITKLCKVLEV